MHDPIVLLKAAMLIPPGFVGAMTGLVAREFGPIKTGWDILGIGLYLVVMYVLLIAALAWMRTRRGRFFGHSWTTWLVLAFVSYAVGMAAALML